MRFTKSPIFYMGNKYDLLDTLLLFFPKKEEVNLFIDLFGGSGVVGANVPYENVVYNELNHNIVELLKLFVENETDVLINHIRKRIEEFDMPNQNMDIRQPDLKSDVYKKAQETYYTFREYYNSSKKDYKDLLVLIHFSFCNLIRFNNKSEFNMPFGNRCYLHDEHSANIIQFSKLLKNKNITFLQQDAIEYLKNITENKGQFIYLDPPYSNTMAIYNESRAFGGWTIANDLELFDELDRLDRLGVKWALSNVYENKGVRNSHIEEWAIMKNYKVIDLEEKQYSALGKGNAKSQEVLIINYKANFETYNIFDFMGE